jgi:hypothetical protein
MDGFPIDKVVAQRMASEIKNISRLDPLHQQLS